MTTDARTPLITLEHIGVSFGELPVLQDVSLDVYAGDYLAIIGPNGAGKTTLIRTILGLISPNAGSITLFGVSNRELTDRAKIGYVPQRTALLERNFPATVLDVVLMGRCAKRGLFRQYTDEDRAAAREALRKVNMESRASSMVSDLSGGQTQRVMIARALATTPEILVLDEPTAGVDPHAQEGLYELLATLNRAGVTILIVTHDIDSVTNEAKQVAYVDRTLTYHKDTTCLTRDDLTRMLTHGHDH